jgi:hypothetical protein
MNGNYIFVKQFELEDFKFKSSRKNPILRFWIEIYHSLPKKLKLEVKTKATNLLKQNDDKFKIKEAITYQFITKKGSTDLLDYMNRFAVFVEKDSELGI